MFELKLHIYGRMIYFVILSKTNFCTIKSIDIGFDCMPILKYLFSLLSNRCEYLTKSNSTNTQCTGMLDSMWMMIFTKEHFRKQCSRRISLNGLALVYFKALHRIILYPTRILAQCHFRVSL